MALVVDGFIQVRAELQKMPFDRFFQYCCIFRVVVFLHFGQMPLSFFCDICGRVGNETPGKRKHFGHEKVDSIGQKKRGDAHP